MPEESKTPASPRDARLLDSLVALEQDAMASRWRIMQWKKYSIMMGAAVRASLRGENPEVLEAMHLLAEDIRAKAEDPMSEKAWTEAALFFGPTYASFGPPVKSAKKKRPARKK